MKALITNDTFISGTHAPAGSVLDLDESTLRLLQENSKAVDFSKATDEQLKLTKKGAK